MRIAMFLSLMMLLTPACSSSSDTDANPPNDSDTDTDVVQTEYPEPERGLTDQTVEHDGMTREYILYVPDTYSSESPTPLAQFSRLWRYRKRCSRSPICAPRGCQQLPIDLPTRGTSRR